MYNIQTLFNFSFSTQIHILRALFKRPHWGSSTKPRSLVGTQRRCFGANFLKVHQTFSPVCQLPSVVIFPQVFFCQCLCTMSYEDDNRSWFPRRKILRFHTGAPNYIHRVCNQHCAKSISHFASHTYSSLSLSIHLLFLAAGGEISKVTIGACLAFQGKSDLKAIAQFLN